MLLNFDDFLNFYRLWMEQSFRLLKPNERLYGVTSTEFCLIYCKNSTNWTFNGDVLKKYNNGK